MRRVFRRPYVYWTVGIFVAYLVINVIASQFYVTVQYIPYYLDQLNWFELIGSAVLAVTIGLLIAINSVFGFIKYQENKAIQKGAATATCAATVGGLSTGVCAACVTGVFPIVMTALGISFSWGTLPFGGMEVQLLTIGILGASLYMLHKKRAS